MAKNRIGKQWITHSFCMLNNILKVLAYYIIPGVFMFQLLVATVAYGSYEIVCYNLVMMFILHIDCTFIDTSPETTTLKVEGRRVMWWGERKENILDGLSVFCFQISKWIILSQLIVLLFINSSNRCLPDLKRLILMTSLPFHMQIYSYAI